MADDRSGPSPTPRASVDAPRATGPKRPPRPERTTPEPAPVGAAPVAAAALYPSPSGSPADVRQSVTDAFAPPAVEPIRPSTPATMPTPARLEDRRVEDRRADVPVRRGRRGRRVKRVVRRIDLWSVLKLSLLVYTCLYLAVLATLAAVWSVLYSSGNVDKLQSFLADVGLDNFTFYGNQMFRACAAIGAVGVIAGTVITVLATALVNLISEMTGGIRLVVIEEEVVR